MVRVSFWLRFSKMCSPGRAYKIIPHKETYPQLFGSCRLHNGVTQFHMQIRSTKTRQMHLKTSPTCLEGPGSKNIFSLIAILAQVCVTLFLHDHSFAYVCHVDGLQADADGAHGRACVVCCGGHTCGRALRSSLRITLAPLRCRTGIRVPAALPSRWPTFSSTSSSSS